MIAIARHTQHAKIAAPVIGLSSNYAALRVRRFRILPLSMPFLAVD